MFRKILIANRGEIACRIIDTAKRMGVETVAIYSDADREARHVAMADQAVRLGPPPVQDSYLKGDAIIQAALESGAEAIHPGYGFLSENPDFVDAVLAAGLTFIGPSAQAIRAMGLKDAAKKLMEKSGVPVVPGYHGSDQSDAVLKANAVRIGYPVMIKAVAGGGGKGMRQVGAEDAFEAALDAARAEALSAFGNDAVLIEKFITNPRHIEMQVFGDGNDAIHLFERDCSLQRRHQKVIEEAPAPGMTDEMRSAMGQAAIQAAKAIKYKGAGTVEFIVDGTGALSPDKFWFMEMNTRLQVEHPVTEAITGIDLVEWQLRVASGETLPKTQDEITVTGHAFEARIYAEDASNGFLPATGRISALQFPQDVRVDSGVRCDDEISPFYDPMIAKLTVHGMDRDRALRALDRALKQTVIVGCTTNIGFLSRLSRQEDVCIGNVDTGLIERDATRLCTTPIPSNRLIALAALRILDLPSETATGFTLWQSLRNFLHLRCGENEYECWVSQPSPMCFEVEIGGEKTHVNQIEIDGMAWRADGIDRFVIAHDGKVCVLENAQSYVFEHVKSGATLDDLPTSDDIKAPMPGLVKTLSVKPGEVVSVGQPLVVLEAMKMQHSLTAPRDGTVSKVLVTEGAQVRDQDLLLSLEPVDD